MITPESAIAKDDGDDDEEDGLGDCRCNCGCEEPRGLEKDVCTGCQLRCRYG